MPALFYRAVIQEVLMFRLEVWAMSDEITRAVEGTYVGFLRHIMGKWARQ